ncbi:DUF2332 family protein [Sulfitobacter sp. HNIBRBA3233]|uniref:DUF2332 domain-containing protein n=1 Tax=Sulfitobacter marinivivus TaxID=3158558 RepID=UPI0032DF8D05
MTLIDAFRQQAVSCEALGSPFMARLLTMLAQEWPADSALAKSFETIPGEPGPSGASLPLRTCAGLHALVLTRRAPALAAVYPPHTAEDADLRDAVLAAIKDHAKFLVNWCKSPPQTNEVRRSAAMIAGAQVAVASYRLPIHLSELGASGGLNMMWDHYALEIKGTRFGPQMPAVTLTPEWSGPLPPAANPRIVAREGVDLNPLDPQHGDDLLRLTAYLWPDQPDRLAMTRAAASVMTAPIAKGDAIDWLARRLASAPQGHLHLIQHSIAWQYFSKAAQARGRALIEGAGARAKRDRPLAWLSMETDGDTTGGRGAAITLRIWPGDITVVLGRADFHGRWIDWAYDSAG